MSHNVGVRELKAKLSHYIELAKRGEPVIITDRGKPVAVIGPVRAESGDAWKQGLWRLAVMGRVSLGEGGKPKGLKPGIKLRKGLSMAQTIIEGREA